MEFLQGHTLPAEAYFWYKCADSRERVPKPQV